MLAVLNGRDALVALPTGFGKSLIYQVPAMIFEQPTIVISPLIALMADQERALKRCGVPVVALHSRLRAAERRDALERLEKGGRLIVLTTPETLESAATAPFFERAQPALLCIDEAHCISEWGHDFRPSYLRLGDARKRLGNPPALALTATATPRVREDIAEAASPAQTTGARRTGSPREPSPDGRHCAWRREVPRRRAAHQGAAPARHHLLRHDHRGRRGLERTRARAYPGHALSREDACGRSRRSAASVHEAVSTPDHGCNERVRHGHRQAEHSLHPALPGSRIAGAVCSGDRPRRTRRAPGPLHPLVRPCRPRNPGAPSGAQSSRRPAFGSARGRAHRLDGRGARPDARDARLLGWRARTDLRGTAVGSRGGRAH